MKRILFLLLSLVIASNAAFARKVSGIVTSGEEKLSGVIVTDGQNFTQTKPNGKFKFEIKDDAVAFFVVPGNLVLNSGPFIVIESMHVSVFRFAFVLSKKRKRRVGDDHIRFLQNFDALGRAKVAVAVQ